MRRVAWLVVFCACLSVNVEFEKAPEGDWRCSATVSCASPLVCELETGSCVECLLDTDCTATTPVCNRNTGRCVSCSAAGVGCTAPKTCSMTIEACIKTCTEDEHCPGAQGCHRRICSTCENDGDCPGQHCNTALGACTQCTVDGQCGTAAPKCHLSSGVCVRCLSNADCDGTDSCAQGNCIASH